MGCRLYQQAPLEIDTTTGNITRRIELPELPYDVLYVPAHDDVYVTTLGAGDLRG